MGVLDLDKRRKDAELFSSVEDILLEMAGPGFRLNLKKN